MFKPRPLVVASLSAAALAVAVATNLPGAERGQEAGAPSPKPAAARASAVGTNALKTPRLDQFDKYYAISVKPDAAALPHKADAHDIVVVFGTSAMQNGDFRTRGLATLRAFLDKLNPTDRVCLLAADTSVAAMTTNGLAGKTAATFVAPDGKEIDAALAKLNRRVPLGSTDMPLLLRTAADVLHASKNPRALVYIGNGMNIGGSVEPKELKEVVELLVAERIPVISYAVGPRVDGGLLARLANHTGGVVGFDNAQAKTDDPTAGAALAAAATEVVVWPEKLQLPEGLSEVYPKRTPPLRADRDTILVGQGKAAGPIQVSLTGTAGGEKKQFSWNITPSAPTDDNAYLAKVVEGAQRDDGESLATVGTAGLMEARNLTLLQAETLRKLAGQMLHVDPRLAQRLSKQAAQIDPDLPGKELEFVAQNAVGGVGGNKAPGEGIVVEVPGAKQPADEPGGLLGKAVQEKKIIGERLQTEVRNQIDAANRLMTTNPQGALESLKVLQQAVRAEPIIDPELRDSLLKQIDGAMARVHTVESSASTLRLQQAATDATRAENRRLQHELIDREKRISQWMAKFDSLMGEKKFTQAESIADLAMAMAPTNSEIANAGMNATMRRAIEDGIYLRRERIRGVLLTLREVEYSHIPTPDEPPVVFPPKEWWDAMTKRREDYKAVSLSSQSDAEKRIMSELQKPTQVEFNETSLKDAVNYLKELHGINIEISQKKLEEANVQLDTPITKVLKGVTLKSALKLILHDLGLAYIVRDEVLLITSKEEADTYLVTKVYPVGDLVVPIIPAQQFGQNQQGGFGQQGQGGFGGQQGGGGQFGGGGGQFGGGGGQQGGGGFFSVPSSPLKAYDPQRAPIKLDSPKRDVRPAAPAAAPAAKPIELKPKQGEDVADAWDRYFDGRKDVTSDEIRATLRELRELKKYPEIVAVIQAALRHGHSQPWMYEAMALAMFAANDPPEEIERALMSAADYANNTTDLMYLGQYIYRSTFYVDQKARERFQARALKIFRQVARLDPTAVDAYVHGLTVAKSLDDADGIRWATVGLMGQAWSSEDRQVADSASRVAKATIQKLRAEKRLKEAQAFEDAVNDALQRDIVVRVSWTGEADIDLLVEEPAGTWCTAQNPRTTSGGILISSDLPGPDEKLQGRQLEAYVCPLAFDGKYRLVLRRAFGRPSADKVKVEIVKHHKERRQNLVERPTEIAETWVEIKDQDVGLSFELDGGRRTRALNDEEIVRSVERAQQTRDEIRRLLWEATDVDSYARAMDAAQQRVGMAPPRGGGPGHNRGVGYQPLIVVIPEGAQLSISAVISGDRRFVRTQVRPQFSFIKEVNTFNFATGASGQSNNPGGNQGNGGFGGGQFGGGGGGGGGLGGGGGGGLGGGGGAGGGGGGFF